MARSDTNHRRPTRPGRLHWSRHITERCEERSISERDIQRVLDRPFVSGTAEQAGVRWHVGRARCGSPATWHWIKVIESHQEGNKTLITSYPLLRRKRCVASDK
jgi:hypothetical protein